jgi:hypothetical protein
MQIDFKQLHFELKDQKYDLFGSDRGVRPDHKVIIPFLPLGFVYYKFSNRLFAKLPFSQPMGIDFSMIIYPKKYQHNGGI